MWLVRYTLKEEVDNGVVLAFSWRHHSTGVRGSSRERVSSSDLPDRRSGVLTGALFYVPSNPRVMSASVPLRATKEQSRIGSAKRIRHLIFIIRR